MEATKTEKLPKLPTLHAIFLANYQPGTPSCVVAGAVNENDLPNLSVPDQGIIGEFLFRDTLEPSKRLQTIADQGGVFGWCKDESSVGAWLGDEPHKGAYQYLENVDNIDRWTWTCEERNYIAALLASRGEHSEWAKMFLREHAVADVR